MLIKWSLIDTSIRVPHPCYPQQHQPNPPTPPSCHFYIPFSSILICPLQVLFIYFSLLLILSSIYSPYPYQLSNGRICLTNSTLISTDMPCPTNLISALTTIVILAIVLVCNVPQIQGTQIF